MAVPKPVRPYHVFVDRVVVTRVAIECTAESASEAARLIVREFEAGQVELAEGAWQEVRTEYHTPFVHRAEEVIYPLLEKQTEKKHEEARQV